jgi:HIRAN domain.
MAPRIAKQRRPKSRVTKTFFTKVAGVTKRNRDGEPRQDLINNCRIGEPVELVPEPDNRYDRNAVAVYVRGDQIGYLSAGVAASLAYQIVNRTHEHSAWIEDIKGGIPEAPTLGVVLAIHAAALST